VGFCTDRPALFLVSFFGRAKKETPRRKATQSWIFKKYYLITLNPLKTCQNVTKSSTG